MKSKAFIFHTIGFACGALTLVLIGCKSPQAKVVLPKNASPPPNMARIPAGIFRLGSDESYEEERPVRTVKSPEFFIDKHEVTNQEFKQFITATGYVTVSERQPKPEDYPDADPKLLRPGSPVFSANSIADVKGDISQWWQYTIGASWRHPLGPDSDCRDDEPVVQVAFEDALAYAHWAGKELPTEIEWEVAARGGLNGTTYIWGNEEKLNGKWPANVWQGEFPKKDNGEDGFPGIAPVGMFPPNGYGLFDMAGNVWEWTTDSSEPQAGRPTRWTKGGSFLCAASYCHRYRPSSKIPVTEDTATNHIGFRCVWHPKK